MSAKLISVVGVSGVGKTHFCKALSRRLCLNAAYEEHKTRPFQTLFKYDSKYALANQFDYLLLRAEQESELRKGMFVGLMDGGLDLDFFVFTNLFYKKGLLTKEEFELIERFYIFVRTQQRPPEVIIHLKSNDGSKRWMTRSRISIAQPEDDELSKELLDIWMCKLLDDHKTTIITLDYRDDSDLEFERMMECVIGEIKCCL